MTLLRIAIDGPASSGKGTVARLVAQALGYRYIDTGAMYRTVALAARRAGIAWTNGAEVGALAASLRIDFRWDGHDLRTLLDGADVTDEIRQEDVGRGASDVASKPAVRNALLDAQRALGRAGGVVMDGRDIGTVVLPDAELKIFLDASLEERARRRTLELHHRGKAPALTKVMEEIRLRDAQDAGRAVAPLRQAEDAVHVDTTGITADDACDRIVRLARERGAQPLD